MIMKKYIVLAVVLFIDVLAYAADNAQVNFVALHNKEIILPLAPIIAKRLSYLHLTHFAKKTQIHNQLGGIKISPINIASRVLFIIDEYTATSVAPYMAQTMEEKRPLIIKALTQDYPEVVTELELLGVFEKQMNITHAHRMLRSSL
jgi:hypothetical protein